MYPELRDYCRSQGYELHIVDLHWKTGLEKQQDHEFPELCLGELARKLILFYRNNTIEEGLSASSTIINLQACSNTRKIGSRLIN